MFDFSAINFADKLFGILIAIIQALVISLLTGMVLNRSFKKERDIGPKLAQVRHYGNQVGAQRHAVGKRLRRSIRVEKQAHATQLCLVLTGFAFFRDFECKAKYLSGLVANGCQIRILLANPHEGYFADKHNEYFTTEQALQERVDYYYDVFTGKAKEQCFAERYYTMLTYDKVKSYLDISAWADEATENNCKAGENS